MPMWLLPIPVRSGRWIFGLLARGRRPAGFRRGQDAHGRRRGPSPLPGAFAVDLSRLAMAAPLED